MAELTISLIGIHLYYLIRVTLHSAGYNINKPTRKATTALIAIDIASVLAVVLLALKFTYYG